MCAQSPSAPLKNAVRARLVTGANEPQQADSRLSSARTFLGIGVTVAQVILVHFVLVRI